MFHWICPECGREIPPAMTECPACDPKPEQAFTNAAPPVQAIPEVVAAALPAPPPAPQKPVPAVPPVLSSEPDSKSAVELALDPLLVLAERIRAAQNAAKEPAAPQPHRAPLLRELAAAVGGGDAPTLELIPVPASGGSAASSGALAGRTQPVARIASPEAEPAPAPVALAEPIAVPLPPAIPQEVRQQLVAPVALAEPVPPPIPQEIRQELAAPPVDEPVPPAVSHEIRQELAPPVVEPAPAALAEPVPPTVSHEIRQELAPPVVEPAPLALAEPVPQPIPQEIRQELATPPVEPAPVALSEPTPAPVPQEIPQELAAPAIEPAPVALAEPVPPPIPHEIRQELAAPPAEPAPVALAETIPPPIPHEVRQELAAPSVEPDPVALAEPVPPPVPQEVRPELAVEPARADTDSNPLPLAVSEPIRKPVADIQPAPPAALAEPVAGVLPLPAAPQPPPELHIEPLVQASVSPAPGTQTEKHPSGSWLKLVPLQDYSAAAARAMRPAAPPVKILAADSGPRVTLPGPALPQQLNVRENLRVATVAAERPRKQRSIPGWVISFLVMAGLLAVGIAVVFYLLPASHTAADAKSAAPEPVTTPAVEASHPISQYIEVTGIRFVMDPNKKSEIQYLVVNHSAAELSDMTVFVTVKTANAKAGQPPLCRFSFRSTGLAPFESKEMTSSIEKLPHPVTLPDWHDLRAEVQIAQ